MAVDLRFIATGAKRVVDSRPLYAQIVVTDDCYRGCVCSRVRPASRSRSRPC
jgi:hypothetical protein